MAIRAAEVVSETAAPLLAIVEVRQLIARQDAKHPLVHALRAPARSPPTVPVVVLSA